MLQVGGDGVGLGVHGDLDFLILAVLRDIEHLQVAGGEGLGDVKGDGQGAVGLHSGALGILGSKLKDGGLLHLGDHLLQGLLHGVIDGALGDLLHGDGGTVLKHLPGVAQHHSHTAHGGLGLVAADGDFHLVLGGGFTAGGGGSGLLGLFGGSRSGGRFGGGGGIGGVRDVVVNDFYVFVKDIFPN